MNDVLRAIAERSSTRGYTKEKLTDEEMKTLLGAALQSPTATNRQEIFVTAVDGGAPVLGEIEAEMLRQAGKGAGAHNFYYEAPAVFILSGEANFRWTAVDAGIAAQSVALAAESMGLGSLIIGCIKGAMMGEREADFAKALRFPEGYAFQIAVAVGHKATEKTPHAVSFDDHVAFVK